MVRPQYAVIIGAGVVGISTAYALAKRGVAVTIVDSNAGPAMGASHANGAQLSYRYTDALASPAILKDLPRLALARDPAFRLHCRLDWQYATWLGRFLFNCTTRKFEKHTLTGLKLAEKSRQAMAALLKKHDIEFGHETNGKLHLYRNEAAFERACRIANLKSEKQDDQQILTSGAAVTVEPALLEVKNQIAGAIHTKSEKVGDPFLFCQEMFTLLQEEYGIKSYFGQTVQRLVPGNSETMIELADGSILQSDIAIICAASNSRALLKPLGIALPVEPMKGYSFEMPLSNGSPKTSITDTSRRIVFTNLGDRMRVAGLADLGDRSTTVRDPRRNALVTLAKQSLPNAGRYELAGKFWAGLRPMTPNSLPIISNPMPGLAINTGHGMLGWTMAMGSGERLAENFFPR
ncbi:MAG: D-amino acid dehydrogenase [Parasphingorhabdus sp.]